MDTYYCQLMLWRWKTYEKESIKGLIVVLQPRGWRVAHYESEQGQKGSTLRPKCKLIVLWTTRKQAKKPVEMLKSRSYWCNQEQFLINISSIQSWIAMLELYTKTEYYNIIVPLIKWYHKHQVDCWLYNIVISGI